MDGWMDVMIVLAVVMVEMMAVVVRMTAEAVIVRNSLWCLPLD